MPRPPKRPTHQRRQEDAVNSHERPSGGHTLDDIDFSDPRIVASIRRAFEVLAEIEPAQTTEQLLAA